MESTRSTETRFPSRRVAVAAVIVGAVVLAASVTIGGSRGWSDLPVQTVHASWAFGYSSTADLGTQADLVVVGTISSVATEGPDQTESL